MDADQRRSVGLVAAAAVIVVVVGLVAALGIERYPDLPLVRPGEEAPGTVAFLTYDREPCVSVAEPDGDVREVRCEDDLHGPLESEDGNLLLYRWRHEDQLVDVVDPRTGEVIETRVVGPDEDPHAPPHGARDDGLFAGGEDGAATLRVEEGGTVRTVLALEGPSRYAFQQAVRSPDGQHAAVVDSGGRLIVVSLVGDPAPRLWAEDVGEVVWLDEGDR